jgi:hypothetical protein
MFEVYIISDGGEKLGLLSVTYGVAEAVSGAGTLSFMSLARARKEGLSFAK